MKWKVDKRHHGMIIRDYLREVHRFSRRILIVVKENGKIIVNGFPQTVRYHLREGDQLEVVFPKEEIAAYMKDMEGETTGLSIVYEDDAVIVVDKPPGMATIPSLNHPSGTVANGILSYYIKNDIPYTVHVVTRLDRDTSGLVLIAKHRYSHSLLASAQATGKVKRKYKAIAEGVLELNRATIDAPIDRKLGSIIERTVIETGKRAVTHYQVLERFDNHTFLEIELETGRTHQIRVHFSHINHPLAGDDLYGGKRGKIDRHALHCCRLRFEHPFTKEEIELESKLPNDMRKLISNQMW